jgi:hypothetical protein
LWLSVRVAPPLAAGDFLSLLQLSSFPASSTRLDFIPATHTSSNHLTSLCLGLP